MRKKTLRVRIAAGIAAVVALTGIGIGVLTETGTAALASRSYDSAATVQAVSTQYDGRMNYGPKWNFVNTSYQLKASHRDARGVDRSDSFVKDTETPLVAGSVK